MHLYHGWFNVRPGHNVFKSYISINPPKEVLKPAGPLVVSEIALRKMRGVCPVDAEATDVQWAFEYVPDPPDHLEDRFAEALMQTTGTEALFEFLEEHGKPVALPQLFNCLPVLAISNDPAVLREHRLKQDDSVGRASVVVEFDPLRVEQFGIVRCRGGYLLSSDMLNIMYPYIRNKYFYIEEFQV